MKVTAYAVSQDRIKAANLPEKIFFESYVTENRPDEAFNMSFEFSTEKQQLKLIETQEIENMSKEDVNALYVGSAIAIQNLCEHLYSNGTLCDADEANYIDLFDGEFEIELVTEKITVQ